MWLTLYFCWIALIENTYLEFDLHFVVWFLKARKAKKEEVPKEIFLEFRRSIMHIT